MRRPFEALPAGSRQDYYSERASSSTANELASASWGAKMEKAKTTGRVRRSELVHQRVRARRFRLIGMASAVVLLVGVATAYVVTQAPPHPGSQCASDAAGAKACDFTLPLASSGGSFTLSAATGPVLIDFMGSRCVSCEREMPHLTSISQQFASRGLTLISIDAGGYLGTEDPQVLRDFMARYSADWEFGLDNQGLSVDYSVVSLPTIYLIDAGGVIAFKHSFVEEAQLASEIETLL